ncbi:putative myosin heavy chain [Trypanosoma conorhini]|uniref:Putative myosin heavy chain n=1 Tax=Trypanosoma conorhini TaxID=83891 RepID=A0A3R7KUJ7_9TRYP|nr:putative myosin heavy chain [Trypanosoma conorhini]RNF15522.1 putative myosin heavy chain [Trypanosoma conorhini]
MSQAEIELSALSSTSEAEKGGGLQQRDVDLSQWAAAAAECGASNGDNPRKQPEHFGIPPLCPTRSSGGGGGGAEAAAEQHLVALLQKASQVIKEERARSAALQQELDTLRQSAAALPPAQRLQQENQELKRQLLSLRAQVSGAQTASETRARPQEAGGNCCPPPPSCRTSSSRERGEGTSSRPSTSQTPLAPSATHAVAGGGYSDAQHRRRQTVSLQRRQLGAPSESSGGRASVGSQQPKQRQPLASPSSGTSPEVPRKPSSTATETAAAAAAATASRPQPLSRSPVARELWRATTAHDCGKAYSLGMITRLRRAMAPQPTKEQLGEVIHAMVHEVLRDVRRRGIDLKMTRQAPCVYRCELRGTAAINRKGKGANARVLHLSIDSGRLAVNVGSGHENFLDYLERHCFLSGAS